MTSMNADVKARWLAALRSGDYVQGTDRLTTREPDGAVAHCCLGVLCELAVADAVVRRFTDDGGAVYGADAATAEEMYLPVAVRHWANLPRNPVIPGYVALATLNDGADGIEPHDFAEIADLIEEHL